MSAKPARPVRILVTGFGPFPGVAWNASGWLAEVLAAWTPQAGIHLQTAVFPVSWTRSGPACRRALDVFRPHAVLHFGVAKRASCFEIETRAFNICGPRADQDGLKAGTYSVVRGGPAILPVTLPYDRLLRALRNAALPSALSRNPGRYICNLVLYRTLYAPASKTGAPSPSPPLPAAFIHIPALGVPDAPPNTLTQDILLEGAKILVSAAAQAVLREQDNGYEWRRW